MKKLAILLACALMLVFACTAVAESVSIAIIYSDTVDDKGWCQSMDSGVKKAIAEGVEELTATVIRKDGTTAQLPLKCAGLTANERLILQEGCLMNYYAAGYGRD